jgi:hypothetical protein
MVLVVTHRPSARFRLSLPPRLHSLSNPLLLVSTCLSFSLPSIGIQSALGSIQLHIKELLQLAHHPCLSG